MSSTVSTLKIGKIANYCRKAIKLSICIGALILFIIRPERYTQSFLNGLALFGKSVLPVLFPFFFITKALNALGVSSSIGKALAKPIGKIYNASPESAYILVMNMISGYPIGASLTAQCYSNGSIDKDDALCITSFCSSGGPIFILGTVNGFFGNVRLAIILLITNYLSAFVNGLLFRNKQRNHDKRLNLTQNSDTLPDIIKNSIGNVLQVGGFIVLFNILIDMLTDIGIIGFVADLLKPLLTQQQALALSSGIIEMTRGCNMLSSSGVTVFNGCIASFMIAFGGIGIAMQSMSYLERCGITMGELLLRKLSQASIAFVLALPLGLVLLN